MNSKKKAFKGNVINGIDNAILKDYVIIVENNKIKEIGPEKEIEIPYGMELIDLKGHTLMPGLIDCHQHLSGANILSFKNYRVAMFEVTPQLLQMYILLHAQISLDMGYTTLRDLGWITNEGHDTKELIAVRDSINLGLFAGPRLIVAGWAVITNSHLDVILPKNAYRDPDLYGDGPWELRKQVRKRLRMGCDLIKTCASGGGGTDQEEVHVRNMTQEELNAIVDEAHAFNVPVACHCFTPESQKMAIKAKVDTIEHCVFIDDEALNLIKKTNTPVIPTLAHRSDRAIEIRKTNGTAEFVTDKMKSIQPYTKETFKKLCENKVNIAMGTDTQIDPERGKNSRELEIYVDYGMSPMDAIKTATKNAAEAINMDNKIGTLEKGKVADIIAVEGDPIKDISILQEKNKIKIVMKEGKIYIDRRPGKNKFVIHNDIWDWERPI